MATCKPPATASCSATVRCCRAPPAASLALLAAGVAALALLALAPAAAQRNGTCPPRTAAIVCNFRCYYDADCSGQLKCCSTLCGGSMCMNPLPAREPPPGATQGECPAVRTTPWLCRSRCSSDLQCRAGLKCCLHGCGGYDCLPPVAGPATTLNTTETRG